MHTSSAPWHGTVISLSIILDCASDITLVVATCHDQLTFITNLLYNCLDYPLGISCMDSSIHKSIVVGELIGILINTSSHAYV